MSPAAARAARVWAAEDGAGAGKLSPDPDDRKSEVVAPRASTSMAMVPLSSIELDHDHVGDRRKSRAASIISVPGGRINLKLRRHLYVLKRFVDPGTEHAYQEHLAVRCVQRQRGLLPLAFGVYVCCVVVFIVGVVTSLADTRPELNAFHTPAGRLVGRVAHAPTFAIAGVVILMLFKFPAAYTKCMEWLLGIFLFLVPLASFYNTLDIPKPAVVFFPIVAAIDAAVRVMAMMPPRAYILSSILIHVVLWVGYPALGITTDFYDYFGQTILSGILLPISVIGAREEDARRRRDFARAQSLRSELAVVKVEKVKVEEHNRRLHEQLLSLQRERMGAADLDSPLAKALASLDALRSDPRLQAVGGWATTALDGAITGLLRSRDVMVPNLRQQYDEGTLRLDRDTKAWLFSEVAPGQSDGSDSPKTVRGLAPPPGPPAAGPGGAAVISLSTPEPLPASLWTEAEAAAGRILPALAEGPGAVDVLELERATGGHALLAIGLASLRALGLEATLPIAPERFASFVAHCETRYLENPYHNRMHVADVLLSMVHMLTRGGVGDVLSEEDKLAACIATIIHDFEHPGYNNNFLVATAAPLALLYNDRSPLEFHHASAGWKALRAPEHDFLAALPKSAAREVRRAVIDVVLATDMAQHFEIIGNFRKRAAAGMLGRPPETPSPSNRATTPQGPPTSAATALDGPGGPLTAEDRRLVLSVAMKACDVGHSFKPLGLHVEWSGRIASEFYNQGDRERALGLPVSPFMDREGANLAKSQLGFLDFVVLPLLGALASSFPRLGDSVLAGARDNYAHWRRESEVPVEAA